MGRHVDFHKIVDFFKKKFGERGYALYQQWLLAHKFDPSRSLGAQIGDPALVMDGLKESFGWALPLSLYAEDDGGAKLYKVRALHVGTTGNLNKYTEEELRLAARSLAERPLNLNHFHALGAEDRVLDAEFEDGAVEAIIAVGDPVVQALLEAGKIKHVSIEAKFRHEACNPAGCEIRGIVFTGLALLTEGVQPGDPLTMITEKLGEASAIASFTTTGSGHQLIRVSNGAISEEAKKERKSTPRIGEPFAGYKDFDDCVAKNADKEDPEAYCAAIQRQVEAQCNMAEASPETLRNTEGRKTGEGKEFCIISFLTSLLDRPDVQDDVKDVIRGYLGQQMPSDIDVTANSQEVKESPASRKMERGQGFSGLETSRQPPVLVTNSQEVKESMTEKTDEKKEEPPKTVQESVPKESPCAEKLMEAYLEKVFAEAATKKIAELEAKAKPQGKGLVPTTVDANKERYEKIARSLREAIASSGAAAAIPQIWVPEISRLPAGLVANLRSVVKVYEQISAKPGDRVKIPRVTTPKFSGTPLTEGAAMTDAAHTIDNVEVTVKEYGAQQTISYSVLEDITGDLVAEIEAGFVDAAKLREDAETLSVIDADVTVPTVLGNEATTATAESGLTSSDIMKPGTFGKAIRSILDQKFAVRPGDLVMVIHPKQWYDLLRDQQFTTAAAATMFPSVTQQGQLPSFMGVDILVTSEGLTGTGSGSPPITTYHAACFRKDAVALVPKRDLLVEQFRDTSARQLRLTGTHRFGVGLAFPKAIVKVITA